MDAVREHGSVYPLSQPVLQTTGRLPVEGSENNLGVACSHALRQRLLLSQDHHLCQAKTNICMEKENLRLKE